MPYFSKLPMDWESARPLVERQLQNLGLNPDLGKSRRKVQPPRNLVVQSGSFLAVITWSAPADDRGITGWRVYVNSTLYATITAGTKKIEVALASGESKLVEISAIGSHPESESPRIPIVASANADLYDGASGGTNPSDPPEWPSEPGGGREDPYRELLA